MPPHLARLFPGAPSRVIASRDRGRAVVTGRADLSTVAVLIDDGQSKFGSGGAMAFSFYADTPNPERLALALEDAAKALRLLMQETA